jgi:hypothetical protein
VPKNKGKGQRTKRTTETKIKDENKDKEQGGKQANMAASTDRQRTMHWGHHFRAKVPRVGSVTLVIQNAGVWGISSRNTPKRANNTQKVGIHQRIATPDIPNGVFNPGYFLSFLRSVTRRCSRLGVQSRKHG